MSKYINDTGLSTLWSKIKTLVAAKQDALPSGTTGQVLTLDSNLAPAWTNPATENEIMYVLQLNGVDPALIVDYEEQNLVN